MTKEALQSTCLDRLPVKEQRELLVKWRDRLITHIKLCVSDALDNGNSLRIRRLISALAGAGGKIG